MVLFFMALATAIRIGELQALSRCFSFVRVGACLSFVHTFVTKCESLLVPSSLLLGCITVRLAAGLDVYPLLCPVRALCIFLDRTASVQYRSCRLFVSLRCPSRALSVTVVSFLLRVVFMQLVLPGLRLAPFARMGSVASPPL